MFNNENSSTIYDQLKNPPFIKSQRLLPISFNTQLLNIENKWNTTPLYNGPIGSNCLPLMKNNKNPYINNKKPNINNEKPNINNKKPNINNKKPNINNKKPNINNDIYFPEIKNTLKPVEMNKHIIKSRFPDKCIGNCFITEMNAKFKKHKSSKV